MKKGLIVASLVLPSIAFAQEFSNVKELITAVSDIVDSLIVIVFAAGLLVFLWGLTKFIYNQGNSDATKDGKRLMIWGTVALFVMVSIWGITRFIGQALGIDPNTTVSPPSIGTSVPDEE